MIKVLLWDIDGTILDFIYAEDASIKELFHRFKLGECNDEMLKDYSKINRKYWAMLERGEMSKPDILVNRFVEFFNKYHIDSSIASEFNDEYQVELGNHICYIDNAYEILEELHHKYLQYAVTNGTKIAQDKKIKSARLDTVFDGFYISDMIGYEKPHREFFIPVLEQLKSYSLDEILIIGDSLSSDITGGNNINIKCCWYNPKGLRNENNLKIDYEIKDLHELLDIL